MNDLINPRDKKPSYQSLVDLQEMIMKEEEKSLDFMKYFKETFDKKKIFIDREESFLDFVDRCLLKATDEKVPILERVRYLQIVSQRLDEYFMIRVNGLILQTKYGGSFSAIDGSTPTQLLGMIRIKVSDLEKRQQECFHKAILPELEKHHINFVNVEMLSKKMKTKLLKYYYECIHPVLTPLAFDVGHPFSHINNLSHNIAVLLRKNDKEGKPEGPVKFARILIPTNLSRFISVATIKEKYKLSEETLHQASKINNMFEGYLKIGKSKYKKGIKPKYYYRDVLEENSVGVRKSGVFIPYRATPQGSEPTNDFLRIEDVIKYFMKILFPGMTIVSSYFFRVVRDSEIKSESNNDDKASDLLTTLEIGVVRTRFFNVVKLQVSEDVPENVLNLLKENLKIEETAVYRIPSEYPTQWLGFNHLDAIFTLNLPHLKYPSFVPSNVISEGEDLFYAIKERDILLHHPYNSFKTTLDFFWKAASDPDVLAIKCTLYKIAKNSMIVESLLTAVSNQKQVTVLVELKARFNEKYNIQWAKSLESQGVHVVYGLDNVTTHAKVAMVIRKESGGEMRNYVHLSTGNYNEHTSRWYSDVSLFTCNEKLSNDVTNFFNRLTGFAPTATYEKLISTPGNLREFIIKRIESEIEFVRQGKKGHLIFKTNNLNDLGIITKLYEASFRGVTVELIVRGICSIRPKVDQLSENIRIITLNGRFYEHSRIFYFFNDNQPKVYLSSADLMPRCLDARIELLWPIESPNHIAHITNLLQHQLKDNCFSAELQNGTWVPVVSSEEVHDSEVNIMEMVENSGQLGFRKNQQRGLGESNFFEFN
eukprot:TRINITY_DN2077_c0_g1_i1.p1 TRINITY_DN2077_c0_g1~~TRINITY_DN2077_c0_g1_i1.p1  ORF type:complete len:831 (+),score=165.61 TRINITY_DN2077_c0_g1_i1:29-2494(+)